MTNVRQYTDKQLLDRVLKVGGKIPNIGKYLVIGVQSEEDAYDQFDDKFYVYDGNKFVMVSTGTTNPGSTALKNYKDHGLIGAAVLKTDQFIQDCYVPGYHKSRMKALRQNKPILYYRDDNKNEKSEQIGKLYNDIIWANMHGVDYDPFSNIIKTKIGGWSFACQVWNRMGDYRKLIDATWKRNKTVDYCLLKEFEP